MWILELDRARLSARLGTTAEERAEPQSVDLCVKIRFARAPAACQTDDLADTVCYASLVESAKRLFAEREFRLLEYMGQQLVELFRKQLPAGAEVEVAVTKVSSPVDELHGGVRFRLRG